MKIDTQLQREIILAELRSIPVSGVQIRLRALPPPHHGWWIEVNDDSLGDLSDTARTDVLLFIADIVKNLDRLGIRAGIIRAPFSDVL